MDSLPFEAIVKIRIIVGYLGEKDQYAWWLSSFLSPGSQAFLAPVFSKTQFLAQCTGVTWAAAAIHDQRIGTGHVYHLFRLPEAMEQDIQRLLHDPKLSQEVMSLIAGRETALAFLQQQADTTTNQGVGPTRVGMIAALRDMASWHTVTAHYASAFVQSVEIFPYFSDIS